LRITYLALQIVEFHRIPGLMPHLDAFYDSSTVQRLKYARLAYLVLTCFKHVETCLTLGFLMSEINAIRINSYEISSPQVSLYTDCYTKDSIVD